jgi:hypothetical protein
MIRDGDWTLINSDLQMGRFVWARQNPDGSTTHRTDYTVDQTIDTNRAQRNITQPGWKGDYHHIASIPLNVLHDGLAEAHSQGDDNFVSKFLNDSDNLAWRTKDGRV